MKIIKSIILLGLGASLSFASNLKSIEKFKKIKIDFSSKSVNGNFKLMEDGNINQFVKKYPSSGDIVDFSTIENKIFLKNYSSGQISGIPNIEIIKSLFKNNEITFFNSYVSYHKGINTTKLDISNRANSFYEIKEFYSESNDIANSLLKKDSYKVVVSNNILGRDKSNNIISCQIKSIYLSKDNIKSTLSVSIKKEK